MTHDTFMHFRHEKKNAEDCMNVLKKLERVGCFSPLLLTGHATHAHKPG